MYTVYHQENIVEVAKHIGTYPTSDEAIAKAKSLLHGAITQQHGKQQVTSYMGTGLGFSHVWPI